MIHYKDVRIGNIVYSDGEMYELSPKDFVYLHLSEDEFDPVPLTVELLEKAGFVAVIESYGTSSFLTWRRSKDDNVLIEWDNYFSFNKIMQWDREHNELNIGNRLVNSVHQIQNIFYNLIGEELVINF